MLLIQNAQVLDPYTGLDARLDLLIGDDGILSQMEPHIDAPAGCPVFDAAGKTVAPGLVDTHVHFRDPGQTQKEDMMTGMRAAAAGGFTSVVCMANTLPTCDNVETLQYVQNKAREAGGYVNVHQACAVTKGLKGEEMTDFAALLAAGAPGFTDDGINLTDMHTCLKAMEEAVKHDTVLSFHEEDKSLVLSPGVNYGSKAAEELGVPGALPSSEEAMVARDIALALRTGARVVFQHISSGLSVDLIRAGKAMGAKIYCEVTPHHLSLTGRCARAWHLRAYESAAAQGSRPSGTHSRLAGRHGRSDCDRPRTAHGRGEGQAFRTGTVGHHRTGNRILGVQYLPRQDRCADQNAAAGKDEQKPVRGLPLCR